MAKTTKWSRVVLLVALAAGGCGGPAVPPRSGPPGSALAADAERAPLPELGSSFEDPPAQTERETAPAGHAGHGHAH